MPLTPWGPCDPTGIRSCAEFGEEHDQAHEILEEWMDESLSIDRDGDGWLESRDWPGSRLLQVSQEDLCILIRKVRASHAWPTSRRFEGAAG